MTVGMVGNNGLPGLEG